MVGDPLRQPPLQPLGFGWFPPVKPEDPEVGVEKNAHLRASASTAFQQRVHRDVVPQRRLSGPLQQGVVDGKGEIGHPTKRHGIRGARQPTAISGWEVERWLALAAILAKASGPSPPLPCRAGASD
jgi:hypothetical protein